MRQHLIVLGCVLSVSLGAVAEEKIYRSTDAEGNPVFSSEPPAPDAEEVDLRPTNTADAVKVRPPPPPEPARPERPEHSGDDVDEEPPVVGGDDDYDDYDVIYDDDARERVRERVEEGRGERPRVNPLPSGPARAGGGGRR